jgi:hypothetical protein
MSDESTGRADEIAKLGLDFGEVNLRAEAIREDGTLVWSNLSDFGRSLADKSARNPRSWKHDQGFNPYNTARKKSPTRQLDATNEAIERMFAPALLDFRR